MAGKCGQHRAGAVAAIINRENVIIRLSGKFIKDESDPIWRVRFNKKAASLIVAVYIRPIGDDRRQRLELR